MVFIIRRNGVEVGKSESKIVSFATPSEFKIGDIVPAGTYTALNRNSFGDSPEVNVPSFEITNSDKPADIIASKITVTPGRTTAIIKDETDRLTSTEDVLTAYDHAGKLVATSEGKTPEVQLKALSSATTYQGYTIKWTNSHGSSSPTLVPDFTTSSSSVVIPVDPKTSDLSVIVSDTSAIVKDTSSGSRANEMMILYSNTWKEIAEGPTGSKSVEIPGLAADTDYSEKTYYVAYRSTNGKESQSCSVPSFTTSGGSVEPTTPTVPVAPKDGDISVSNIQQTTATVTDTNSDSIDRSAEQLKVFLDTDRQEWTGKTGELSISLDGLEANRYYGGRLTVGYYNPTTKKSSDKVPVPRFATKG